MSIDLAQFPIAIPREPREGRRRGVVDDIIKSLVRTGLANTYAASYGGPLYLVGSALSEPYPFDLDLRLVVPASTITLIYGDDEREDGEPWSRCRLHMAYDRLKQSRRLTRRYGLLGIAIDFQVQSEDSAPRYATKPRRRLDSIPDWFWRAGESDA